MIEQLFFIKKYVFLLSFLNIFFGGLLFISLLVFLFGDSFKDIFFIWLVGFFGLVFFDSLIFFFGRFSKKFGQKRIDKKIGRIEESTRKHPLSTMMLIKIAYGFSMVLFFFLGRTKRSYKSFILLNSLANIIFVSFFVFVGFFSRMGTNLIERVTNNKTLSILVGLAFILSVFFVEKGINRFLLKKTRKINKIKRIFSFSFFYKKQTR